MRKCVYYLWLLNFKIFYLVTERERGSGCVSACVQKRVMMTTKTRKRRRKSADTANTHIIGKHTTISSFYFFFFFIVHTLYTILSAGIKFNLFVVFDFDVVIVVYDYCVTVWVSMKRKNVDSAAATGTFAHTQKSSPAVQNAEKPRGRRRRSGSSRRKNRIFRFHLDGNVESLFSWQP